MGLLNPYLNVQGMCIYILDPHASEYESDKDSPLKNALVGHCGVWGLRYTHFFHWIFSSVQSDLAEGLSAKALTSAESRPPSLTCHHSLSANSRPIQTNRTESNSKYKNCVSHSNTPVFS